MSSIIWVLIPLVAIVGAYIIDYQKNKLKWQAKNSEKDHELGELRSEIQRLQKRVENLEAIATDVSPGNSYVSSYSDIEMNSTEEIRKENELSVAKKATLKNR
ncbi:MAG: hypothetical protein EA391_12985 [Balneolaceae bacterium]|nr:MAG: hypothetical protein EA391_12985 [Balneolaceae bacterium]